MAFMPPGPNGLPMPRIPVDVSHGFRMPGSPPNPNFGPIGSLPGGPIGIPGQQADGGQPSLAQMLAAAAAAHPIGSPNGVGGGPVGPNGMPLPFRPEQFPGGGGMVHLPEQPLGVPAQAHHYPQFGGSMFGHEQQGDSGLARLAMLRAAGHPHVESNSSYLAHERRNRAARAQARRGSGY